MKNFSKIELQEIYNDLNNGIMYTLVKNGVCNGEITAAGDFIRFSCYGSSAIKNTVDRLEWLLNVMYADFDDITPAVYSYSIFNTVDITGRYKSRDLNTHHKDKTPRFYWTF
jgi:hypothetical protein